MASLKLGRLLNGAREQISLEASYIYNKATKQTVSQYIQANDQRVTALENNVANKPDPKVVNNIAARDALTVANDHLVVGKQIYVLDASADNTVTSGAASYIITAIDGNTVTYAKMTEFESLDIVQEWSAIQNKPTSAVASIDQAVTDSHTHSNKAILDAISTNQTSGNLVFNSVELNGETGIAYMASADATPAYTGKIHIIVEEFDPEAV